ncbi:MAG: hypothetical protein H5U32_21630 [Pseudomonas balearica]|uniref:hypothetical protein n=1 Tax=Stutzerimonas balearica TaxID=74829 RepID=UPI0019CB0C10|nr:hypothetical protein [Stutzerimonas balearica]MBC7201808.1 hypothetical protein [Stutzerimonas balearica]
MPASKKKSHPYAATLKLWRRYWATYGGASALLKSLYLFLAVILTGLNYFTWSISGWWDIVITTIPTLLGFTLAGLAVFLSMDSGFSKFIAGSKRNNIPSPFMGLVSSFAHFIIVQVIAFVYAITAKSLYVSVAGLPDWYYRYLPALNVVGGALGYFLFLYAIMLVLGATFAIFRISTWYEMFISTLKKQESETDSTQ